MNKRTISDYGTNLKLSSQMSKFLDSQLIGTILFEGQKEFFPNTTYETLCPDCTHQHFRIEDINSENFPDELISYKINNYGYRSDDFGSDAYNNFLFSGCSVTFGTGLPYNETWAHRINYEFGGAEFKNLAMNGGSIQTCINDIYNYIRNFGNPKAVFLMIPNIGRDHYFNFWEDKDWKLNIKMKEDNNIDKDFYDFVNSIRALEDYLEALDIPFIWSTWSYDLAQHIEKNNFKNYISMQKKINYSWPSSLQKSKYWDKARDGLHYSSSMQYHYYQIYRDEWKNKYEL